MHVRRNITLTATVLMAVAGLSVFAQAPAPSASLPADQATRGKVVFEARCSECHDGGIMGPELWGSPFVAEWKGKSLRSLFDLVMKTMPADNPGTLNEKDGLDLVAYLLRVNGIASMASLDSPAALDSMTFTSQQ
ncbi:MAG: cytochrome c [Vicinamibacterales bacterium]